MSGPKNGRNSRKREPVLSEDLRDFQKGSNFSYILKNEGEIQGRNNRSSRTKQPATHIMESNLFPIGSWRTERLG